MKDRNTYRYKRGMRGEKQSELKEFMKQEKQKLTYPQENWSKYNRNQTKEKHRFLQLLNLLVNTSNIPEKPYLFGRPSLRVSDIVKCCAIKVYTNLSCRKVIPELEGAYDFGIIGYVPHYNRINAYMREKWMSSLILELIELSALPFSNTDKHFSVDATGFGNKRFATWFDHKYGKDTKRREFLKLNLICSTENMIVPTVVVSEGRRSESPSFKTLINRTAENFEISEVYADAGYSSRENHEVVKRNGGQAFIPFKSNSSGKTKGSMEWRRAFKFWLYNPKEFQKAYGKRSLSESLFSSVKRTRLSFIRSKDFTAGKNEILLKVLCHNLVVLANSK